MMKYVIDSILSILIDPCAVKMFVKLNYTTN